MLFKKGREAGDPASSMNDNNSNLAGAQKWRWVLAIPAVLALTLPKSWDQSGLQFGWELLVLLPVMALFLVTTIICAVDGLVGLIALLRNKRMRSTIGIRLGIDFFVVGVFAFMLATG